MPDEPHLWDCIPPEMWRKLLAIAYVDEPFNPADVALDAGLDEAQTAAFKAWCKMVDHEDDIRRMKVRMSPSDKKFIKSLGLELAPHSEADED